MSGDGSVLPQAEIDVLFKQATGKNISPPPAAEPTAPGGTPRPSAGHATPGTSPPQRAEPAVLPVQAVAPAPSDDVLETIQATLADLAQRMTEVETSISRLGQKERGMSDVSIPVQRLSQRLEAVARDLQKVNGQVGGVLRGLQGTPGYGIRNHFTCESCGSHGLMAIPMRCSKCGSEGWWGWWPKEK